MQYFQSGSIDDVINFWTQKKGFQRANRFKVLLQKENEKMLEAAAVSVQLPSRSIEFIEDNTMGASNPPIKIPIKSHYDDRLVITFAVDSYWEVRQYIEEWMNTMFPKRVDYGNDSTVAPYDSCLGYLHIMPLTVNHDTAVDFVLRDVYPKTILPGQMDQNAMDTPLPLMVDFNYRYYQYKSFIPMTMNDTSAYHPSL